MTLTVQYLAKSVEANCSANGSATISLGQFRRREKTLNLRYALFIDRRAVGRDSRCGQLHLRRDWEFDKMLLTSDEIISELA